MDNNSMDHVFKLALGVLALSPALVTAQTDPGTILEIDTQDAVWYVGDTTAYLDFAKVPSQTPPTPGNRNFRTWTGIQDVVAVHGKPARVVLTNRSVVVGLTPTPVNGQAIADVARGIQPQVVIEILQTDGTPVGSLMLFGFFGGMAPPGPLSAMGADGVNLAVIGGTGAFAGIRGQASWFFTSAVQRGASVAEDPGFRR